MSNQHELRAYLGLSVFWLPNFRKPVHVPDRACYADRQDFTQNVTEPAGLAQPDTFGNLDLVGDVRAAAVPRQRPESRDRRHRTVEHGLPGAGK